MNLSKISKKRLSTYTAEEARALLHEAIRRTEDLMKACHFTSAYAPQYVVYNNVMKMERAYKSWAKAVHLVSVLMEVNASVVPTLTYGRYLTKNQRAATVFNAQFKAIEYNNEPMSRHLSASKI